MTGKIFSLAALGLVLLSHHVDAISQVNPYNYHTLNVEGRGAVDIVTNQLKISMTISNTIDCKGKDEDSCDSSSVQEKTNEMTKELVSTMANQTGVVSITSGSVSLQPQTQWNNQLQTNEFVGFTSSIQLSAIVDGDQAGNFLDEAVRMGVNNIGGIDYFISDKVMKDSQQEALQIATEDAMTQANAVLNVTGYSVKSVKSVNVPYINSPFKDNGPADLDNASKQPTNVNSAVKTVGYVVKLLLKY